jgi:cytoskeletal protein RodZ
VDNGHFANRLWNVRCSLFDHHPTDVSRDQRAMATVHLVKTPDQWMHQASQQADGRTGFGQWLKRAREARGLTLADITRETKIPLRNLEALEHGDLGFVPAFYERAEVRAIARAVGVDEGLAIGRLDSAITPAEPQSRPRVSSPDRSVPLSAVLGAVSLALLIWILAGTERTLPGGIAESPGSATEPSSATANPAPLVTRTTQPSGSAVVEVSQPAAARTTVESAAAAVPLPAATPEALTSTGTVTALVVRTDPPGAQVTVNGIGWGVSPVTIRHLPPGTKHIRVTKEGFAATQRVVTIDSGQQQALDLQMAAGQ